MTRLAALYFDYDGLLRSACRWIPWLVDPVSWLFELAEAVPEILREEHRIVPVISRLYVDYPRINQPRGYESVTRPFPRTQLAVDLVSSMFIQPEISISILVSGDLEYLPLATYLVGRARPILVIAPRKCMSGDLLHVIGRERYMPAEAFLGRTSEVSIATEARN